MTSYDAAGRPDLNSGIWTTSTRPSIPQYVGAPQATHLLSRTPDYWLHNMTRNQAISVALQLQCDAGLIVSNLQVFGQFVTSLNRISSDVTCLAFGQEPYPSEAIQSGGWLITWQRFVCGIRPVPRVLRSLLV